MGTSKRLWWCLGLVVLVLMGMLNYGMSAEQGVIVEVTGYDRIRISEPHTHKNMTLFVISKADKKPEPPPRNFITLEEGLAMKVVLVTEKQNAQVSTLQIENHSDRPLFIQIGDVVKGGKQDRTIRISAVVPPKSGKVDVPSLCVEQGRWHGQKQFNAAGNYANSNAMKMAIQGGQQGKVWNEVAEFKKKAELVTGDTSKTSSLNETMDSKKMQEVCQAYEKAFSELLEQYPQAMGVAYALNGKLYTVELFQTNGLFQKAFPKVLKAYTNEAVVNQAKGEVKAVTNGEVKDFLILMEKGETKQESVEKNRIIRLENGVGMSSEVQDESAKVMHRQYLVK